MAVSDPRRRLQVKLNFRADLDCYDSIAVPNLLVVDRPRSFLVLFFVPKFLFCLECGSESSIVDGQGSLPGRDVCVSRCPGTFKGLLPLCGRTLAKKGGSRGFSSSYRMRPFFARIWIKQVFIYWHRGGCRSTAAFIRTHRNTCTVSTDKGGPRPMAADFKSLPVEWYA